MKKNGSYRAPRLKIFFEHIFIGFFQVVPLAGGNVVVKTNVFQMLGVAMENSQIVLIYLTSNFVEPKKEQIWTWKRDPLTKCRANFNWDVKYIWLCFSKILLTFLRISLQTLRGGWFVFHRVGLLGIQAVIAQDKL